MNKKTAFTVFQSLLRRMVTIGVNNGINVTHAIVNLMEGIALIKKGFGQNMCMGSKRIHN